MHAYTYTHARIHTHTHTHTHTKHTHTLTHPSHLCTTIPHMHRARVNKGVGVENVHYLCDGLWIMKDAHR